MDVGIEETVIHSWWSIRQVKLWEEQSEHFANIRMDVTEEPAIPLPLWHISKTLFFSKKKNAKNDEQLMAMVSTAKWQKVS